MTSIKIGTEKRRLCCISKILAFIFQYESTEEADLTGAIADSTTFEAAKVIPGTMISNYKPVQWSNKYTGKK